MDIQRSRFLVANHDIQELPAAGTRSEFKRLNGGRFPANNRCLPLPTWSWYHPDVLGRTAKFSVVSRSNTVFHGGLRGLRFRSIAWSPPRRRQELSVVCRLYFAQARSPSIFPTGEMGFRPEMLARLRPGSSQYSLNYQIAPSAEGRGAGDTRFSWPKPRECLVAFFSR